MPNDPDDQDDATDAPAADGPPDVTPDEDRAAILARRRALVRRSIASIGVIVGGLATADCAPQPCLDIALPTDATDADAAAPEAGGD